ncbi:LacI family DNA-binding transcriptional regulator [Pelomonas sp. KK5]|uniref:LacI family DNA-binding transcriptional regulator n=1 Tax=Pelomonas sp. KK5 TaxID=1855730 RepID=UPI00097C5630|nr:LacI family DNA-binding transcriptional regulator [Pelomonas sp. KK5]
MKSTTSDDANRRQRRGHGRPTLHDVADAAGVTRITVSRYIREPGKVAPETAARIQAAIEQTGYVPNHQAGQLASGASRIVAALIPNVGHSIFAETIQGLTEGLRDSGRELLLMATGYSLEVEETQLRTLLGWAPGALVVTGRHHTASALQLLRDAHAGGTAVVEIWDHPEHEANAEGFARIGFDHRAVGRTMARHLIEQGHRSLAYVDSGVAEDYRAHERGQGFAAEAKAAGAQVKVLPAGTGDAFDAGRAVLRGLGAESSITAAAFANDHLACGALMEAQALGIAVPGRLALLGFGDFPIGRQLTPALSTMRPPRSEIGQAAAEAVLEALSSGEEPGSRTLPCELIVRGSSIAA